MNLLSCCKVMAYISRNQLCALYGAGFAGSRAGQMDEESVMSIVSIEVDAQRAFTPLCPEELPVVEGHLIVPQLNAQAALADYRVLTRDAHSPQAVWVVDSPQQMLQPLDYPHADLTWVRHAEVGTDGFLPLPGLPEPEAYDFLVHKGLDRHLHPYGACFHDQHARVSTGLLEWLQVRQARHIVVGGLATDYCVKDTVLQLCRYNREGWQVWVNLAACRGIAPETVDAAQAAMCAAGAVLLADAAALAAALAHQAV